MELRGNTRRVLMGQMEGCSFIIPVAGRLTQTNHRNEALLYGRPLRSRVLGLQLCDANAERLHHAQVSATTETKRSADPKEWHWVRSWAISSVLSVTTTSYGTAGLHSPTQSGDAQ